MLRGAWYKQFTESLPKAKQEQMSISWGRLRKKNFPKPLGVRKLAILPSCTAKTEKYSTFALLTCF